MTSAATDVQTYLEQLPEERKAPMQALRAAIQKNIPKGFEETMSYGMIGYVVPHSIYKAGYHCNPTLPLPFMSIASQKNFIAVYHMGMYADEALMTWFKEEFVEVGKAKLDIGKSCMRFKKIEEIPLALIGKLASKMTTKQWIDLYEKAFVKK